MIAEVIAVIGIALQIGSVLKQREHIANATHCQEIALDYKAGMALVDLASQGYQTYLLWEQAKAHEIEMSQAIHEDHKAAKLKRLQENLVGALENHGAGNYRLAVRRLEWIQRSADDDNLVAQALASVYMKQEKYRSAEVQIERVKSSAPDSSSVELHAIKARLYLELYRLSVKNGDPVRANAYKCKAEVACDHFIEAHENGMIMYALKAVLLADELKGDKAPEADIEAQLRVAKDRFQEQMSRMQRYASESGEHREAASRQSSISFEMEDYFYYFDVLDELGEYADEVIYLTAAVDRLKDVLPSQKRMLSVLLTKRANAMEKLLASPAKLKAYTTEIEYLNEANAAARSDVVYPEASLAHIERDRKNAKDVWDKTPVENALMVLRHGEYSNEDLSEAQTIVEEAANYRTAPDMHAAFYLGEALAKKTSSYRKHMQARHYLMCSAKQGHPGAIFKLALMDYKGWGTAGGHRYFRKAERLFKHLLSARVAIPSEYRLGSLYYLYKIVYRGYAKNRLPTEAEQDFAVKHYLKKGASAAVHANDAAAAVYNGKLCRDYGMFKMATAQNVKAAEEGFEELRSAADKFHDPQAKMVMGMMYVEPPGNDAYASGFANAIALPVEGVAKGLSSIPAMALSLGVRIFSKERSNAVLSAWDSALKRTWIPQSGWGGRFKNRIQYYLNALVRQKFSIGYASKEFSVIQQESPVTSCERRKYFMVASDGLASSYIRGAAALNVSAALFYYPLLMYAIHKEESAFSGEEARLYDPACVSDRRKAQKYMKFLHSPSYYSDDVTSSFSFYLPPYSQLPPGDVTRCQTYYNNFNKAAERPPDAGFDKNLDRKSLHLFLTIGRGFGQDCWPEPHSVLTHKATYCITQHTELESPEYDSILAVEIKRLRTEVSASSSSSAASPSLKSAGAAASAGSSKSSYDSDGYEETKDVPVPERAKAADAATMKRAREINFKSSELDAASFASQRSISQVKVSEEELVACRVVPAKPDGSCGFTATRLSLMLMGKRELAASFDRNTFIQNVTVLSEAGDGEALILAMFDSDGVDSLTAWQAKFRSSDCWVGDSHFKLLSYLHNVRFKVYATIEGVCQPEPGNEVVYIGRDPDTAVTVSLLHDCNYLIDPERHLGMTHFDGLLLNPTASQAAEIDRMMAEVVGVTSAEKPVEAKAASPRRAPSSPTPASPTATGGAAPPVARRGSSSPALFTVSTARTAEADPMAPAGVQPAVAVEGASGLRRRAV